MKLVLEILSHTDDTPAQHRVIEKFPVTLGRGFHNDIILSDPHLNPLHLSIDHAGGQWVVSDLNSDNGITAAGTHYRGQSVTVNSGDVVRAGQTELRFYSPNHPVTATIPIQRTHPLFQQLMRPVTAWVFPVLAIAIILGWAYIEIWVPEPGMMLAATAAMSGGIIATWSALWSVAGRMIGHRSRFRNHVVLISLYLIAAVMGWYITVYADFLANENALADTVTYGVNFFLLGILLYNSLALTSRMAKDRRIISAASLSAGVMAGIFVLGLIGTKNFVQQPMYPATLAPYLAWVAPGNTPDEFIRSSEKIFAAKKFTKNSQKTAH